MSVKVANFPTWDGTTTRHDNRNVDAAPNASDYDQLVAEALKVQEIVVGWSVVAGIAKLSNSVTPPTATVDKAYLYCADVTAGQAAVHAMTEDNKIIKLFQQAAITPPSGGGTVDSQARTAVASVITALQAAGFLA